MQSIDELAAEICTLAGHINAANHRFLALLAEFDRRKGWTDSATQYCAHWLNWKCGIALGAAREKVRIARALENLPLISAAMASGRLSYSNAREITRVATPANEDYLLSIADHGTAHTSRRWSAPIDAARKRKSCRASSTSSRIAESAFDTTTTARLSSLCHLPADAGALVLKALDIAVEASACTRTFPPERPGSRALQRAPCRRPRPRRRKLPGARRARISRRGSAADRRPRCSRDPAQPRRPAAARSSTALPSPRKPRDASPATPAWSRDRRREGRAAQRRPQDSQHLRALARAAHARDKGCRFPGCSNARYIDMHHIKHWAKGGETRPSNLVSLCRFHHREVHEGGFVSRYSMMARSGS